MVAIALAGGIPPLIALLASASTRAQEDAAGALFYLSANAENKVMIASPSSPLIAPLLLHLIELQQDAAATLANLSERVQISSAGAVFPLDRAAVIAVYECPGGGGGCTARPRCGRRG